MLVQDRTGGHQQCGETWPCTADCLFLHKDDDSFSLEVRDDGIGFDAALPAEGLGLASMHERVRFFGGTLEIKSQPDEGTELNATLPVTSALS